jgi:hypothetical protein
MNQAQRNQHIQHARAEIRAGRPVMATWLTPGTGGQHVTRVVLTAIQHFAQHMVPLDAVDFVWPVAVVEPVVEPVPVEPELTPGEKAEVFLRNVLAIDPVPALEVQRLADAADIKPKTLRRTRERLNVRCFKRGGCWWWELPEMSGQ